MRFVDDFLLITREESVARAMVQRLSDGIGAYNCTVNEEKGAANFILGKDGAVLLDEEGKYKKLLSFVEEIMMYKLLLLLMYFLVGVCLQRSECFHHPHPSS